MNRPIWLTEVYSEHFGFNYCEGDYILNETHRVLGLLVLKNFKECFPSIFSFHIIDFVIVNTKYSLLMLVVDINLCDFKLLIFACWNVIVQDYIIWIYCIWSFMNWAFLEILHCLRHELLVLELPVAKLLWNVDKFSLLKDKLFRP